MWFYSVNLTATYKHSLLLKPRHNPERWVLFQFKRRKWGLRQMMWSAQDHIANTSWDLNFRALDSKGFFSAPHCIRKVERESEAVWGARRAEDIWHSDCEALELERWLCKGQERTYPSGSPPWRGGMEARLQREKNTIRTQEGAPHPNSSLELFLAYPLAFV